MISLYNESNIGHLQSMIDLSRFTNSPVYLGAGNFDYFIYSRNGGSLALNGNGVRIIQERGRWRIEPEGLTRTS